MTTTMIEAAYQLAELAHRGQIDKLGVPYFEHVNAVAELVKAEWPDDFFKTEAIVVAYLHDIVEDTEITLDGLSLYFPKAVVKAVDAITKRKGESNKDYYLRCKQNWIAGGVKRLDVKHNQSRNHLIEDGVLAQRLYFKYLEAEMALAQD